MPLVFFDDEDASQTRYALVVVKRSASLCSAGCLVVVMLKGPFTIIEVQAFMNELASGVETAIQDHFASWEHMRGHIWPVEMEEFWPADISAALSFYYTHFPEVKYIDECTFKIGRHVLEHASKGWAPIIREGVVLSQRYGFSG